MKPRRFPFRMITAVVFQLLFPMIVLAQLQQGIWKGSLHREDHLYAVPIVFKVGAGNITFINEDESIAVNDLQWQGDSLFFDMPVFESSFRLKSNGNNQLKGIWIKGVSSGVQVWQVEASLAGDSLRFGKGGNADAIDGKWAIAFTRASGSKRNAVGEFSVNHNMIKGTIRTPSGDYRYLDGIVRNDSVYLGTFDGSHAFLLMAKRDADNTLSSGVFYTGAFPAETFTAVKDDNASLPAHDLASAVGEKAIILDFCFRDLQGNEVCLADEKFRNKAIVLQLMGSWCPNCMDETKWLSEWYRTKPEDVEVISLAYELSEDFDRSVKSVQKFRDKFNVPYTMLITGARVSDAQKTAKTLQGLPEISLFPTTIFLNNQKKVMAIHPGFYGPAAPEAHAAFIEDFMANLKLIKP